MSKISIRNGVFETNSSSVHSICISKAPVSPNNKTIGFYLNEYGWENESYNAADYLYTAMVLSDEYRDTNCIEHLKNVLDKYGVHYTMENPDSDSYYYIDHFCEVYDFVDSVMADETLLLRTVFGDSVVYTGNDNEDARYDTCCQADEYISSWDCDNDKWVSKPNPYHNEDEYDYFKKGN